MVGLECPRCSNLKTWDHVILCSYTNEFRRKFIEDLLYELRTKKLPLVEVKDAFVMTEDILVYLEKWEDDEYITNQHIIGMRYLFRGFLIKVWKGVNLSDNKCRQENRILMQHCVRCYRLCWDNRNEALCIESTKREQAIKWY